MHIFCVIVFSVTVIGVLWILFEFLRLAIKKKSDVNSFFILLAYVFLVTLILRLIVLVRLNEQRFGVVEMLANSIVSALQSFSLDADYAGFLEEGKRAFGDTGVAADVYGVINSLLNVIAPIIGGAVIFEILTGMFPRLKVWFHPFSNKFVFSELNDNSITLAENIIKEENYRKLLKKGDKFSKPLVIFTDAYPDSASEQVSELFERARSMKAICLKTDIKHMSVRHSKMVYYFLMDKEEHKNIESLNDLLNEPGCMKLWPKSGRKKNSLEEGRSMTNIYVFCRSDYSITLVNNIIRKRKETISEALVRPVRDYSNMAYNLMHSIPLFTSLSEEERDVDDAARNANETIGFGPERVALMPCKELHVTLIGSGNIAEEIFKAVFWCGQMAGYLLHIHVISKTAKEMKTRIDHDCPELFESCREHSKLLRLYQYDRDHAQTYAPPYAVCNDFIDDVDAEFIHDYPREILEKTDYFVVALGSDEKNIYVASMLSEEIQRRLLHEGKNRHPVIVPIIYDDQLAETLRSDRADPEPYAPYFLPFGNLRERFSCKNIFMIDVVAKSLETSKLYNISDHMQRMKDDYNYWSNIARTIHAPYKVFSLSRFLSRRLAWKLGEELNFRQLTVKKDDENDHIIAWMEHRRWNAYMRSKGFSCPDDRQHALYTSLTGSCKNVPLKLHPCLVECGIKKQPLDIQGLPLDRSAGFDQLDLVSIYDYLIMQAARKEHADGRDAELFYNKKKLLYCKSSAHITEKYGIHMKELAKQDYKQYDSVAYDNALQSIIRYEQP